MEFFKKPKVMYGLFGLIVAIIFFVAGAFAGHAYTRHEGFNRMYGREGGMMQGGYGRGGRIPGGYGAVGSTSAQMGAGQAQSGVTQNPPTQYGAQ